MNNTDTSDDDYEGFFSQREWLSYTYRYAKASRMSPWGLTGCLLSRICAMMPPNIVLRLTDNDLPLSLNSLVALVGPTGSGKGKAMGNARHLTPLALLSSMQEINPKTGESIPAKFIDKIPATDSDGKPLKGEYTDKVHTDRCLMFVPEILSIGAAMSKQGSNLLPILLTAFSNEPLGDDTKGKQYQIKLPPYSYRFSAIVGVQPSNSGILFDQSNSGLAGRFLYLPSTDMNAPSMEDKPDRPEGAFPFDANRIPMGNSFEHIEELLKYGSRESMPDHGRDSYPLREMRFPSEIAGYVDDLQLKSVTGVQNALDSHRIEVVAKMAALFRLIEECKPDADYAAAMSLTDDVPLEVGADDWNLALRLMGKSDETRSQCDVQRRDSVVASRADFLASQDEARLLADENRLQVTRKRILTVLEQKDKTYEGIKGYLLRRECGHYADSCYSAIESLYDDGKIERVGPSTDKVSSGMWCLSQNAT